MHKNTIPHNYLILNQIETDMNNSTVISEAVKTEEVKQYKPEYKRAEVQINGEPITREMVTTLAFSLMEYLRFCREMIIKGEEVENFGSSMVEAFQLLRKIDQGFYDDMEEEFSSM